MNEKAKALYDNASKEVKACMDIINTMNADELNAFIMFMQLANTDYKAGMWILKNYEKVKGLQFDTCYAIARNELKLDKEAKKAARRKRKGGE